MEKKGVWKEKQELRVEDAANAAKELFYERGIECVKMTDIAARAGFGVASLYRYPATATKSKIVVLVGCKVWNELLGEYKKVFDSEEYQSADGCTQIQMILSLYPDLYQNHKDFIKFIGLFDAFCLENNIAPEKLQEYETAVLGFYPYYEAACNKGMQDGSIRRDFRVRETYFTVNHSMLALLKKVTGKAILEEDRNAGLNEIEVLIDIFSRYLK